MFVSDFNASDYQSILPELFVSAIDYVKQQDLEQIELGKHAIPGLAEDDAFFMVMEYETVAESQFGPEFHQKYCDVQFIVKGEEQFGWAEVTDKQHQQFAQEFNYDPAKDICFTDLQAVTLNYQIMRQGAFYLFTPKTVHMPNLLVSQPSLVRKVVIKIKHPK